MGQAEEHHRIGHDAKQFQQTGLHAMRQIMQDHHSGIENKETYEKGQDINEIGDNILLGDCCSRQTVGQHQTQIIQEGPVPATGDAQDTDPKQ